MGSLSIWHWLIIAVVFVMFFGAKRLPGAARSLGQSLRIFKSEVSQMQSDGKDGKGEGDKASAAVSEPKQLSVSKPEQVASATEVSTEKQA